jgi:hypothetical protein
MVNTSVNESFIRSIIGNENQPFRPVLGNILKNSYVIIDFRSTSALSSEIFY